MFGVAALPQHFNQLHMMLAFTSNFWCKLLWQSRGNCLKYPHSDECTDSFTELSTLTCYVSEQAPYDPLTPRSRHFRSLITHKTTYTATCAQVLVGVDRNDEMRDKYSPAPSTSIPPPLLVAILSGKPRRRSGLLMQRTLSGSSRGSFLKQTMPHIHGHKPDGSL